MAGDEGVADSDVRDVCVDSGMGIGIGRCVERSMW